MIYNDKINQKPLTCFDFINIFPLISHSIKGAKHNTEGNVIVAIAIVVEVEHPSISAIVVIAPAFHPRVRRVDSEIKNSPNPSQLYDNIIVSLHLFKCNTNEKSRSFFAFYSTIFIFWFIYDIFHVFVIILCILILLLVNIHAILLLEIPNSWCVTSLRVLIYTRNEVIDYEFQRNYSIISLRDNK